MMAVMRSFKPMRQPNMEARSPTMAVSSPINIKEKIKVSHPPPMVGGGIRANNTCNIKENRND